MALFGLLPGNKPETPFLWGGGGQRVSQDDVALQRRLAAQQMQAGADYSPVGHWTQGLARLANGFIGGQNMRRADQSAAEARAGQQQTIEAILAGQQPEGAPDPIAAALADPELRQIGLKAWEARQPQAIEPVLKQQNDGSYIGINPATGEVMFNIADPNPKPALDWISVKNDDGTTTLVPIGVGGPITEGGGPASGGAPGAMPPDTLPPDFDFDAEPGRVLQGASQTQSITPAEASTIRASLGPNGQAAFEAWMRDNNIVIAGQ